MSFGKSKNSNKNNNYVQLKGNILDRYILLHNYRVHTRQHLCWTHEHEAGKKWRKGLKSYNMIKATVKWKKSYIYFVFMNFFYFFYHEQNSEEKETIYNFLIHKLTFEQ